MPAERQTIPTSRGYGLASSLELPAGPAWGAAVFAHCFTCTQQSKAAVEITRRLARAGIASLRFDFTGLGKSEGEFGRAGFAIDVADLVDAGRFMIGRCGGPLLLVGHSLGGAAVLAAADDLGFDAIAGIATIGAPADVSHVLERIEGDLEAIRTTGEGDVSIGGRAFRLAREFLERIEHIDLLAEVARLRVPLLFMHSPTDNLVSVENAGALFAAAMHPKSFVSLEGAGHLLLDGDDAAYAAGIIAAWASRYLGEGEFPPGR
ncbi:alpha/beta hydrolase family protein [Pelagerythrobacter aerophilus]|uniref:Alpha/beta hydrolase n=1 Tax=Pelagerythrobacter aerophilus TaxID=2306995 RepID=A0A418NJC8_9SPHN|nr:alpha/beta fold hydrolase [Pelagerythrobacter aerophilus]RIV79405.1 alpha/beta hydrolase [Pelagerythrobacter aerophilus]